MQPKGTTTHSCHILYSNFCTFLKPYWFVRQLPPSNKGQNVIAIEFVIKQTFIVSTDHAHQFINSKCNIYNNIKHLYVMEVTNRQTMCLLSL